MSNGGCLLKLHACLAVGVLGIGACGPQKDSKFTSDAPTGRTGKAKDGNAGRSGKPGNPEKSATDGPTASGTGANSSAGSPMTQGNAKPPGAGLVGAGPEGAVAQRPQDARFKFSLQEPLVEHAVDFHVRRSDGAFVALGSSGVVQISTDDGASWTPTCSLPEMRNLERFKASLSSEDSGGVIAVTSKLRIVDEPRPGTGPCRQLSMPAGVDTFERVLLSKKRIVLKSKGTYFTTENLGETWSQLVLEGAPSAGTAEGISSDLAVDPGNPERITLASCESTDPAQPAQRRLVLRSRSSDNGPVAALKTSLPCDSFGARISFERDKPGTIYSYGTSPSQISGDGGQTWSAATSFSPGGDVALPEGGFIRVSGDQGTSPAAGALVVFQASPGGKDAPFVDKGTFTASRPTGSVPLIRGGKGRFLYADRGVIFASVDGGATFKPTSPLTSRVFMPADLASRDGVTIWAVDSLWRVAASHDGGSTWKLRYGGPADLPGPATRPRIYVHPYNDRSLVLHEEAFKTSNPSFRIATADGFQKADARNVTEFNAYASTVGFLVNDAETHFVLNMSRGFKAKGAAAAPIPLPSPPPHHYGWSPYPDMLSLPSAPGSLFFGASESLTNIRYGSYDVMTGAKRDLLSEVDIKPAGHVIAHTATGPRLRVVSQAGQVRESADGGVFVDVGASPLFDRCERRLLSAFGSTPSRMATACLGSAAEIGVTTDGGTTWTKISGEDLANCEVSRVVTTATSTFVACGPLNKVLTFAR